MPCHGDEHGFLLLGVCVQLLYLGDSRCLDERRLSLSLYAFFLAWLLKSIFVGLDGWS